MELIGTDEIGAMPGRVESGHGSRAVWAIDFIGPAFVQIATLVGPRVGGYAA